MHMLIEQRAKATSPSQRKGICSVQRLLTVKSIQQQKELSQPNKAHLQRAHS